MLVWLNSLWGFTLGVDQIGDGIINKWKLGESDILLCYLQGLVVKLPVISKSSSSMYLSILLLLGLLKTVVNSCHFYIKNFHPKQWLWLSAFISKRPLSPCPWIVCSNFKNWCKLQSHFSTWAGPGLSSSKPIGSVPVGLEKKTLLLW